MAPQVPRKLAGEAAGLRVGDQAINQVRLAAASMVEEVGPDRVKQPVLPSSAAAADVLQARPAARVLMAVPAERSGWSVRVLQEESVIPLLQGQMVHREQGVPVLAVAAGARVPAAAA